MLHHLHTLEHQVKVHQDQLRKEADVERMVQPKILWFSWFKPKAPALPKVTLTTPETQVECSS